MFRLSSEVGPEFRGDLAVGVDEGGATILGSGTGRYGIQGADARSNIALNAGIMQVATKQGIAGLASQGWETRRE